MICLVLPIAKAIRLVLSGHTVKKIRKNVVIFLLVNILHCTSLQMFIMRPRLASIMPA